MGDVGRSAVKIDPKTAVPIQVLVPVERLHPVVQGIFIDTIYLPNAQQNTTGQTRPQADPIGQLKSASKTDPGHRWCYILRAKLLQLGGKQRLHPLGAAGKQRQCGGTH